MRHSTIGQDTGNNCRIRSLRFQCSPMESHRSTFYLGNTSIPCDPYRFCACLSAESTTVRLSVVENIPLSFYACQTSMVVCRLIGAIFPTSSVVSHISIGNNGSAKMVRSIVVLTCCIAKFIAVFYRGDFEWIGTKFYCHDAWQNNAGCRYHCRSLGLAHDLL